MMKKILEEHPYYISNEIYDNRKGQLSGYQKVVFDKYVFQDEEGGILYIYISQKEEIQWLYKFPSAPYFIQKIACSYENGPEWIEQIIKKLENNK